jgi:hypothetical protein
MNIAEVGCIVMDYLDLAQDKDNWETVFFWDIEPSSYLTGDILRLRYRVQLVNAM